MRQIKLDAEEKQIMEAIERTNTFPLAVKSFVRWLILLQLARKT